MWHRMIKGLAILSIITVPVVLAANSPLLAWRSNIYNIASFAGIFAMSFLFLQPMLAARDVPNINPRKARILHQWVGGLLALAIVVHVVGLWITSPPDAIDALLFRSPTPFSAWGVVAMWGIFGTAFLAWHRKKLPPKTWRIAHVTLAIIIVIGSVVHAIQIQGSMETVSKALLCAAVVAATVRTLWGLVPTGPSNRPQYISNKNMNPP